MLASLRRILVAVLVLLGLASPALAQRAWLATAGPGDDVYEVYGHNAIVIDEPDLQRLMAYNWGVFDFNQPNFVGRFILGRMLYSMTGDPKGLARMGAEYDFRQREFHVRELNLSPTQLAKLRQLCEANDTPGSRDYRYEYFRDNCATRVRDKVDQATGGQVAAQLKGQMTAHTFRYYTDGYAQRTPWLYVGLHYVLGQSIDRPLSKWDECFIPELLDKNLDELEITWEDGTRHKLLGEAKVLVSNTRGSFQPPPRWWPWFLLAGVIWGGAIWGLARFRASRRWLMPLPVIAWEFLCLVAGGISTFGWLFTDHIDSRNNENWLQLSPLSLPMLVAGICLLFGRRRRWMAYTAALPLALSLLGALLKVLPMMDQPNGSIILLAIPVHAGVMLAVRRTLRSTP